MLSGLCFLMFWVSFMPPPPTSMDRKVEQRTVLRFLVREGKRPIDCWRQMTTVFGAETMSKSRIRVWHKRFLQGRDNFKDDKHTGRPRSARTTGNIRSIQNALGKDRTLTVRQLAQITNMAKSSVHGVLKKDLKLSKIAPKLVPKDLTDAQKAFRKRICEENLELLRNKPDLMDFIVTGDESWVSVLELSTKQASSEWIPKGSKDARPTKARKQRSEQKAMLTVFFDKKGVVLAEFLRPGKTVDSEQYCEVLLRLKENIRRKRPHLWGRVRRGENAHSSCTTTMHRRTRQCRPLRALERTTSTSWLIPRTRLTWLHVITFSSQESKVKWVV